MLIDPCRLNLYAYGRAVCGPCLPLMADDLGVSLPLAERLFLDALLVVIFGEANAQAPADPAYVRLNPSLSDLLDYAVLDTRTLPRLYRLQKPRRLPCHARARRFLSDAHGVCPDVADKALFLTQTLFGHSVDRACVCAKLDDAERRYWFALQGHFLQKNAYPERSEAILAALDLTLCPPKNTHSNYQRAFKKNPSFDQSRFPIENRRWLLDLAIVLPKQKPFFIGRVGLYKPAQKRRRALYVGAFLVLTLGSAPFFLKEKTPPPEDPAPKTLDVVIPDVAVVRQSDDASGAPQNQNDAP